MYKKNNRNFWNKFYKKKLAVNKPSNFAIFIHKFLKKKKIKIVDVGCGNGRDLIFNYDFVKFNYKKYIKNTFSIYSRFTWHTINKKDEIIFLKKISSLTNLQYIFIETRSDKDDLFGKGRKMSKNEYITDHYRRFINKNELIKNLKKNFKILYLKESKGFSKFKNEDPCLIRIIAINKLMKT